MNHTSTQFFFPTTESIEAQKSIQVVVQTQPLTKADKGRTVFNSYLKDGQLTAARKEVIMALRTQAGLTEKGAATYYQNMKKKAGLVVAKV